MTRQCLSASSVPLTASRYGSLQRLLVLQALAGEDDPADAATLLFAAGMALVAENYPQQVAERLIDAIARDAARAVREVMASRDFGEGARR